MASGYVVTSVDPEQEAVKEATLLVFTTKRRAVQSARDLAAETGAPYYVSRLATVGVYKGKR